VRGKRKRSLLRAVVAFFAAADEGLGALAQSVPLGSQGLRLIRRHAAIGDRVGHVGDKQAELADERIGGLVQGAGGRFRLDRRELTAGLFRQPVEDARIAGEHDQLGGAVERIRLAAALVRRLAPFVEHGRRDAEGFRDLSVDLRLVARPVFAGLAQGVFEDVVGFFDPASAGRGGFLGHEAG